MSFLSNGPIFNPEIELKSKKCIDTVLRPLSDHATIKINGSLTSEGIFRTVISMSVNRNSVHSVTARYQNVACEKSLRYHLKKLNMEELIKSNEKILLQEVVKTLKTGKSYEFAVNYTNDPYYGRTDSSNEKYVISSQAKKPTNSFYSYISLYSLTRTKDYFICSSRRREKTKVEYLYHFIDLIKEPNFKIKVLCMDREFYCTDVFEFLQKTTFHT